MDDPIASLNKAMMFLNTAISSRFPPTNNQLRISPNPRTQATIQDGKVIVHNEEQQYFLAADLEEFNLDCDDLQLNTTSIFKADHVDASDSDCDEAPTASEIFMARLSPTYSVNGDDVNATYVSYILFEYMVTIENDAAQSVPSPEQNNDNAMILSVIKQMQSQVERCKTVSNKYFKINDLKAQLQEKSIVVNMLKQLLATLKGKNQVTPSVTTNLDSRFQKLNDENVSLAFKVSSLVKEREHLKLRARLQVKFSEPQLNQNVVEKNDLSKRVTSHFHTNKVIEKCKKVLAPCLLRIESESINAHFKNNRDVHYDYLKVTKEHITILHELSEQARALNPLDENLVYACKFAEHI
ncbi:hypothetical protein Tco_0852345 [Tanacetum coccineum]